MSAFRYTKNSAKAVSVFGIRVIVYIFLAGAVAMISLKADEAESALLVSDSLNDAVLSFNETNGAFVNAFVPARSGGLSTTRGIAFGPDANFYVSSLSTDSVLRYNGTTGAFINTFIPPNSGGLSQPAGLAFGPDRNLYVSSILSNSILQYNGLTGAFINGFVLPSGNLGMGGTDVPEGLVFGPDGKLYVATAQAGVLRYNSGTGSFDVFVPEFSGGLFVARDLVFGSDGNLYVTSFVSNNVLRYNGNIQEHSLMLSFRREAVVSLVQVV